MKAAKIIATLFCGLFFTIQLYAGAGTTGGVVLKETVGAKALALGDAFTALASGADAVSWNPAGVALGEKKSISAMYMNEILDVTFMSLNAALPFSGQQGVGASIVNLAGGDIELNALDGTSKTVQAENDYVLSAAYAKALGNLSLGATVKYLKSELVETESASGYALDFGALYTLPQVSGVSLGAVVQNIGAKLKYISEGDPLPLTMKAGIAYTKPIANNQIILTADLIQPKEVSLRTNVGIEYCYHQFFSARAGYKLNYDVDTFTAGFGLLIKNFIIDYAFAPKGVLGDTYKLSLTIGF